MFCLPSGAFDLYGNTFRSGFIDVAQYKFGSVRERRVWGLILSQGSR